MFFRMAGSFSRSIVQTIVPVGVYLSVCVIYSGFVLPAPAMLPWLAWIRYINPLYFALESVMINEVSQTIAVIQPFHVYADDRSPVRRPGFSMYDLRSQWRNIYQVVTISRGLLRRYGQSWRS